MQWLGDYKEDDTLYFLWSSNDANGASVIRTVDGTVQVYKDNNVAQSVAGITDTEDFDGLTGIHACTIDLSSDAFYAVGADYSVVLAGATIDGQTVNAVLAHFGIENRFDEVNVMKVNGTAQTANDNGADINAILIDTGTTLDTLIKDIPTVAEFEARSIVAADYVVVGDTIAGVTAVTNDVGITQAGADKVWGTAARALTDKVGFGLSTAGILAIWHQLTANIVTANTIGKLLKDDIDATISSRSSHTAANVRAETCLTGDGADSIGKILFDLNARLTAERAGYLEYINNANLENIADISTLTATEIAYLNATISSRSSHNAAAIWSAGSRELSTPSNYMANVTALALEATLTAMKGATFAEATDSLEAIRDQGDAAWITGAGGDATEAKQDSIIAYVDELETRLSAVRAGYLDNLSAGAVASEATLTAIKGSGWTDETLKAIKDVIDTIGGEVGPGALECTWTQKDDGGNPMDNVQIWITTDEAGVNVIAGTLLTNASGQATFMLDAGTYYVFREKGGYNFTNPQEWTVS